MAPASGTSPALGCVVCRSRKVRCDRSRPSCQNCQRLGTQCPGYENEGKLIPRRELLKLAEDIYMSSGVERRRFGSCEHCRAAKERCSKSRPFCRRCSRRGLQCVYRNQAHGSRRRCGEEGITTSGGSTSMPAECHRQSNADAPRQDISLPSPVQVPSGRLIDDTTLRDRLVHIYFGRVHPLRCSSFVHKPSFLFSMDRGTVLDDHGEPLLYAMCALAARVLTSDNLRAVGSHQPPLEDAEMPASFAWAETARKSTMHNLDEPSLQQVMTLSLLCDHALETDQFALAYLLAGNVFRAIRLLGLDVPRQPDGTIEYEAGLRLVWASFFIDAMFASGVTLNSSWHNTVPQIPLPCSHRDFLTRSPGAVQYIHEIQKPEDLIIAQSLDLPALTILLVRLRSEVLRVIREPPPTDSSIWDSTSAFMNMIGQLETFRANLPDRFTLTDLNIYIHKGETTLGAVFALHFLYHAAVFDLTRIALPGFNFPLAFGFRDAPDSFRSQCQERCRFHANAVSDMVAKGVQHTPVAFDDAFCIHAVSEATRINIIYSATVANGEDSMMMTTKNVRTNLRLLRYMHLQKDKENPFIRLLQPLCRLFGFHDLAEEMTQDIILPDRGGTIEAEVTGSADVHHLASFAPFRRAKSQIQSMRACDPSSSAISSDRLPPQKQPPVVSVTSEIASEQLQEASMEEYARAAELVGEYLTWDMSELMVPDVAPPWVNFEWPNVVPDRQ